MPISNSFGHDARLPPAVSRILQHAIARPPADSANGSQQPGQVPWRLARVYRKLGGMRLLVEMLDGLRQIMRGLAMPSHGT